MNIAITAPAGPVNLSKLKTGVKRLKSLGYGDISIGESCYSEHRWNSAPAEIRAAELEDFWFDPEIDLVFAARGGFGCIHLLDLINWQKMQQHEKVLCGHSDVTILHMAFMKYGISRSVSGIMPAVEFASEDLDYFSLVSLQSCLSTNAAINLKGEVVRQGLVQGRILPVTLSVFCSLLGSSYMPALKEVVLCLEDINESPYRLDAYLSQLKISGVLAEVGGLIWGDFSNCGTEEELNFLIEKYSQYVDGPIIKNVEFGHCLPRMSFPAGNEIIFKVNQGSTIESLVS
ncbi:MAG: LD-carboxypeptidase [Lentisphaerales bacterium]|nr:LD-carboxypeptidase [Lentisphaerales bacterium]